MSKPVWTTFYVALKQNIERDDTRAGKVFDRFIQGLIVLSLISFPIETLPDLPANIRQWFPVLEAVSVGIFTVEYILRLAVARRRARFFFSFYGLIDLAAILPFYIASGIDLRSLRAFRLLRLFRAVKLLRYGEAIKRFHRALTIIKEELTLFACVTMLILYLSAVGVYYFENAAQPEAFSSVFDGLWWSVVTLTTVGYGDVYPITLGGRVFTFAVLVVGLGVVAVPTGLLASALSKAREEEANSQETS